MLHLYEFLPLRAESQLKIVLDNSYGPRNTASGVNMIAARSAMVVLAVS